MGGKRSMAVDRLPGAAQSRSRGRCVQGPNFALAKTVFTPTMAALLSGHPLVLRDDSPLSASGAEALMRFTHPTLPTRKQQQ